MTIVQWKLYLFVQPVTNDVPTSTRIQQRGI